jgi:hypothetical protein
MAACREFGDVAERRYVNPYHRRVVFDRHMGGAVSAGGMAMDNDLINVVIAVGMAMAVLLMIINTDI